MSDRTDEVRARSTTAGARELRAYLSANGVSITRFCEANGLDRIQVQRVLNGERTRISVDFARNVERATSGAVAWHLWSSETLKPVPGSTGTDG